MFGYLFRYYTLSQNIKIKHHLATTRAVALARLKTPTCHMDMFPIDTRSHTTFLQSEKYKQVYRPILKNEL